LVLGQDGSVEKKKVEKRPTRWEMGPTTRPEVGPTLWDLVFPLMALHIYFFFSYSMFAYKHDVPKRLDPFGVRKVPETKKCAQKRVSCSIELKPN
jgi:hypothetical protein